MLLIIKNIKLIKMTLRFKAGPLNQDYVLRHQKRIFYLGFTHMNEAYTLATRLIRNEDIYNNTSKLFESKNRINSNVTLPIWGGDLVFDISGEIDDANSLKSIMLFRRYH